MHFSLQKQTFHLLTFNLLLSLFHSTRFTTVVVGFKSIYKGYTSDNFLEGLVNNVVAFKL